MKIVDLENITTQDFFKYICSIEKIDEIVQEIELIDNLLAELELEKKEKNNGE